VPLPIPFPQQSPLFIRARLMRELLGNDQLSGLMTEDAVPLGVLAVQDDTPQWLDPELLRQPARRAPGPGDLQADLARQYERLLGDVLAARRAGGLTGDFAAANYFALLPPVGMLPKEAIDPVNGRQGFFPENYQVTIAPIRQSDVELIKAESLSLPFIDLGANDPVDVIVLAPLSNLDYGHYAAQLERTNPPGRDLARLDPLRLKLYPTAPVHALDTDANIWTQIWDRLGERQPLFVRRPTRAAETGISGIVLALGAPVPPPTTTVPGPADGGGLIQDEDAVFLRRLDLDFLAGLRAPVGAGGAAAFAQLKAQVGGDAQAVRTCAAILLRIERQYDELIWPTLRDLAAGGHLAAFLREITRTGVQGTTPEMVVEAGTTLALATAILAPWSALVP